MRMIVTGCAGFLGFHLTRRLLASGHDVLGLDNLVTGSNANLADLQKQAGFSFKSHDICQPFDLPGKVDRIYNLACPASPVDFHDKAVLIMMTCSVGMKNILDLALAKQALILHSSTSECYGDPPPEHHPQKETYRGNVNQLGPRGPYDEGKRFAEALVMSYHRLHALPTRMVRIFNTYGPNMRANDGRALPNFISQALANQPITIHGDGSQTRSFCYVDDLVEAILRTADSDFFEPINIGNDTEITIRQCAETIIELSGSKSQLIFVDRPLNDPDRRRPDLTRAKDVLGWHPTMPYREGFTRTIDYFRSIK